MPPPDLTAVGAWYADHGIAAEPRAGGLWIANPAAPGFGVQLDAAPDQLGWTLVIPARVPAAQAAEVAAALGRLNAASPGVGRWRLDDASELVGYALVVPAGAVDLSSPGLMDPLVTVIEQGNSFVHALVEIIAGRERADYVDAAVADLRADS